MYTIALLILLAIGFPLQDGYRQARDDMVRIQIAGRGVSHPAVLRAMNTVPRHLFVRSAWIDDAYDDSPLPIGRGQTISQPYIVAYMTELLNPHQRDKILEVGTGSGYQAAILSTLIDSVFSVEIIKELCIEASARLKRLGYHNVATMNADGFYGWNEHAPYDAIIVTAAAEYIPPPLIEQLKDGGKMVIPVGSPFLVQTLMLVEKRGKEVTTRSLMPVRFVPLSGDH
ncbi:MAG: protein-L-isoaspartate(D-aspartate) O-methyltransferase [Bacteroidota bacterium]